jgi:hypothetical protein
MRYKLTVVFFLAVALLLPGTVLGADAKLFEPHNKRFTIMIPAGEHTGHQTRMVHVGNKSIPVESAECLAENGVVYVGASVAITAATMSEIPKDERLDVLGDCIVKSLEGEITEKKDIMQDPVPGKEFAVKMKTGNARLQLYTVAGTFMYAVVIGKSPEEVGAKPADEFFASFKLADKEKELYRKHKH